MATSVPRSVTRRLAASRMQARLRTASARLGGGPGDVPVAAASAVSAAACVAAVATRPTSPQ